MKIKVLTEMHRNSHVGRLELQCTPITLQTKHSFESIYFVLSYCHMRIA